MEIKVGTFLRPVKENTILLDVLINSDNVGTRKQLHNGSGSDDGRDAQLHEGTTVGRHDDAHPIEGVGRLRTHDTV